MATIIRSTGTKFYALRSKYRLGSYVPLADADGHTAVSTSLHECNQILAKLGRWRNYSAVEYPTSHITGKLYAIKTKGRLIDYVRLSNVDGLPPWITSYRENLENFVKAQSLPEDYEVVEYIEPLESVAPELDAIAYNNGKEMLDVVRLEALKEAEGIDGLNLKDLQAQPTLTARYADAHDRLCRKIAEAAREFENETGVPVNWISIEDDENPDESGRPVSVDAMVLGAFREAVVDMPRHRVAKRFRWVPTEYSKERT